MVLDVADVSHGVAHLEIHFVGTVEHIVEHFLQLLLHFVGPVAHLNEKVTILTGLKSTLLQGSLQASGPLGGSHQTPSEHGYDNKAFVCFHIAY